MTAAQRAVRYSNAKIFFQSFLMLMTVQPSFVASSQSAARTPVLPWGAMKWWPEQPARPIRAASGPADAAGLPEDH